MWCSGSVVPQHVGSSQIRDWIHVSCSGRWILYHWVTREATACMLNHFSHVQLFETLRTIARQAPLSTGIPQAWILEWVAMPSSSSASGIEPLPLVFPTLAGGFFSTSATWEARGSHYFTIQIISPNFFLPRSPAPPPFLLPCPPSSCSLHILIFLTLALFYFSVHHNT